MDVTIVWDLEEDEKGNVVHIAEHGMEKDDVAHVFDHPTGFDKSDSSGHPMVFGCTIDGRYIAGSTSGSTNIPFIPLPHLWQNK
jgi:hypothetical protein